MLTLFQMIATALTLFGVSVAVGVSYGMYEKFKTPPAPKIHSPPIEIDFRLTFPSLNETIEFTNLADIVYVLDENGCSDTAIPNSNQCHYFRKKEDGTEVVVLTSDDMQYISVIYAGTDEYEDIMRDTKTDLVPFGPEGNSIEPEVFVHEGFNLQTFGEGLFDEVLAVVTKLHQRYPTYSFYTAGHSLGASNCLLAAAALQKYFPDVKITSISIGTPRIGDNTWKDYVNENQNLRIFRFVFKLDIFARIKGDSTYQHVGHTVQLNEEEAEAFYFHEGDKILGYKGVTEDWQEKSFYFPISGSFDHLAKNYISYLYEKSSVNSKIYYVNEFEYI